MLEKKPNGTDNVKYINTTLKEFLKCDTEIMLVNTAYRKRCQINWESFNEVAFLDSKKNPTKQPTPPTPTNQPMGFKGILLIHRLCASLSCIN